MKIVAIIPARYKSSRFPGKPLALICGEPMIKWVYNTVSSVQKVNEVYVATDDKKIYDTVIKFGGNVIMTSEEHTCGTDRLAECAEKLKLSDNDIVLNVQGDEPLIKSEMIKEIISVFENKDVYMGTLKKEISSMDELNNCNVVKVITDINDNAIYFSRFPIPYIRDNVKTNFYKHIGIYGYKKSFLLQFSKMKKTKLEIAESLEQLRVIENGYKLKVKLTSYETIGVDTPEQLIEVERKIQEEQKNAR